MTPENTMVLFKSLEVKLKKFNSDINKFYIHCYLNENEYYEELDDETKYKMLGVALSIFYSVECSSLESVVDFMQNNIHTIISVIEQNLSEEDMDDKIEEWGDKYYNDYC